MKLENIIDNIKPIEIQSPVNIIIRQLKELITTGQLKPGDRLPAERILAEKFGVSRGYIREAILKLEFYGLLKTSPQSGTYVAGYSLQILDSIFTDIINFNKEDFASLIEGRYYLEINAAKLAAVRRTDEDIAGLENALILFESKVKKGYNAVDEDMLFHIKIASATKNSVIESMILILIPDLIKNIVDRKICTSNNRNDLSIQQHRNILNAIIDKNPEDAALAMETHLSEVMLLRNSI